MTEERLKEIETRKAEIKSLLEAGNECDIDALAAEIEALDTESRAIEESLAEARKKAEEEAEERAKVEAAKADEQKAAERRSIAEQIENRSVKASEVISYKEVKNNMEVRNTPEYIDAYAEYIKHDGAARYAEACREILTRADATKLTTELDTTPNGTGTIAVPDFVWDIVKTNWEKNELLRYVRKVSIPGELKVNFEISATAAQKHVEGASAISKEQLVHGIVKLTPVSLKKIIAFSDEIKDLRGEAFIRYLYDEVTQKIYKKLADEIIASVVALSTVATSSTVAAPRVTGSTLTLGLVAECIGKLSDEAANPIVVMNKGTWASFKALQYAASFPVDPFENCTVVFNNSLPTFAAASSNSAIFMIVGDFNEGYLVNEITRDVDFKFDDLTRKGEDMIEILGRKYVGYAPVAMNAFVNVKYSA